jgi:O-antigen/teichoic acid export membrane protein
VSRVLAVRVPASTLTVAVGLLTLGATSYVFLVVTARVLGPERYAPLSALWALVFLVGPGVFLPLEQEVARVVAGRRSAGAGSGPVIRSALVVGAASTLALAAASLLAAAPLTRVLLGRDTALFIGFLLGIIGFYVEFVLRGVLSAQGRYKAYSSVLGGEGVFRLAACGIAALLGARTAGPYGVALGAAPLAAGLLAALAVGRRGVTEPGPPMPLAELSSALGYLLLGSVLSQVLINGGPLVVKALAREAEQARASRFLAALVVARVPLFLFQAVQAVLVPTLARLLAAREHEEFAVRLHRLVVVVASGAAATTVGGLLVGPTVVRSLFGAHFALGHRDLGLLGFACGAYMLTIALAQVLIALAAHRSTVVAWCFGVAVFALALVPRTELLLRVEAALAAGAAAAAVAMGCALVRAMRRTADDPLDTGFVVEATLLPLEP